MKTSKTLARRAALALLSVALLVCGTGCGALARIDGALASTGAFDLPASDVDDACAVTVDAGFSRGRGLIVGPRTVLTVAHVVAEAQATIEVTTSSLAFTNARIVRRIPAEPEDIVVLELELSPGPFGFSGFEAARVNRCGEGSPAWVLTQRGPRALSASLDHGDSGSPVLDAQGLAVALVVGRTSEGGPVLASFSTRTELPAGAITTLNARR